MRRKWFPFLLAFLMLLTGCTGQKEMPSVRVVTQVDVTCSRDGQLLHRRYTAQEKMEPLLNYLRLLEPRGRARVDPERTRGNAYQITLHFSHGAPTVYYQRCERFLSKNRHPWQEVDSQFAGELYPILRDTPADV